MTTPSASRSMRTTTSSSSAPATAEDEKATVTTTSRSAGWTIRRASTPYSGRAATTSSQDSAIGGNGRDPAHDVVVQADDKIVVVGTSNKDIEFGGGDVAVIRLDGPASLDTRFNDGTGMNTLDVGGDEGVAVALQNLAGDEGASGSSSAGVPRRLPRGPLRG